MKMILTLITVFSFILVGQGQRPSGHPHYYQLVPMSDIEFQQAFRHIERESFDDGKMRIAKGVISGNLLLARQVRKIVSEFSFKANQEEIAMYAYPKTYDQHKFYIVYDVFTFNSSKDKVSKWVSTQSMNNYEDPYYGPVPIMDADFAQALRLVQKESFDDGKMRIVKQLVDGNYIYADQVAVLVKEFSFKNNQEQMAKYAYPKTYDQKNYYLVYDAFTYSSSKRELDQWLERQPIRNYARPYNNGINNNNPNLGNGQGWNGGQGGNNVNGNNSGGRPNNNWANDNNNSSASISPTNSTNTNRVILSEAEFLNLKNQLMAIPADQDKLTRVKHVSDQTYWSAAQVKELVSLFIFEDMRLDFAKYAYPKTINPQHYYLVKGALTDPNKKRDLEDYIQHAGGNINSNPNTTVGEPISGAVQAMTMRDFQTAKNEIIAFSSDNDRLVEAKKILINNFLTTAQIKEVMNLFIFEDIRLKFAKDAYQKTFDPQNYATVKAVLVNPSSKQYLQQYIDEY